MKMVATILVGPLLHALSVSVFVCPFLIGYEGPLSILVSFGLLDRKLWVVLSKIAQFYHLHLSWPFLCTWEVLMIIPCSVCPCEPVYMLTLLAACSVWSELQNVEFSTYSFALVLWSICESFS